MVHARDAVLAELALGAVDTERAEKMRKTSDIESYLKEILNEAAAG